MDIGTLRGLITAVLLILFIALGVWAWSRKREDLFDEAARMPLDEPDRPEPPDGERSS
ncbi:MAG: CcoQ/FixQ family Cbb3-type cytochrome c oxidase assembly chaperone [Woeseiaceae bacterium]|nr:CcoQ/FixQ family Cbb3-type cytochrome c oxidase assembly chaperone [Woeseiaceae bacterium]